MNVLSLESISKTLNDEPLFAEVSFGLEGGDHVGLIGHNGSGKSTFLRLLCGYLRPDSGTISMARDTDLVMLDQGVQFDADDTARTFLYKGQGKRIALLNAYHELIAKEPTQGVKQQLIEVTEQIETTGTWNLENDFISILGELGLYDTLDQKMDTLSGGMQKKVAIARVLCAKPTMILLDEPTNHLDIETIEWLEKYLSQNTATMIIVTHDRYFLDSVCNSILELDRGRMYFHPGSFAQYLERRAQRLTLMQKEQDRLTTILRRELQWLKQGAKARTGKDTNRKDRIGKMLDAQHSVSDVAQSSFTSSSRRLGKKILEVKHISKAFDGKRIIEDFSFSFTKGQKIGVVGPNGSGKSTLLDILCGHILPDSGIVDAGVNTLFAYYDQTGRNLDSDKTILEYVEDISERITLSEDQIVTAARFLEIFSFPASMHRLSIGTLSGGEKRRLYLVSRLMSNPNFLMLDEPTNDLDLQTMENLEQYVQDFAGCTLVVSHDRAFLDCTCDQLFVLGDDEQGILSYPGPFSEWRLSLQEKKEEEQQKLNQQKRQGAAPSEETRRTEKRKGLSFKEKKEFEQLSADMESLQSLQAKLEASFSDAQNTELGTLGQRTEAYHDNITRLEEMENRWLELAEKEE
ncbi:ATPase component of ABC transporters with duplicated ATPase domain [Sphaerochaeta pleomorpha str. Grapes]|uniref:ATPase component of ABC transporters with duplicated ATPase domain n=1 Tax=Sphaerochaeta pleomorpha (strain ATCC BAA-1885 / DSM 22778 / Grapes) TaxID=158190 RepID=G8QQW1_SPHPG|nr:ABC-F family ATP-binding cassette domain-containing protein [Sphaerochaeta pleomorpha]AEV28742.1 ATPase component of ABC transporters with duplicated ATPase domain [Sphaerochaeta pleomorpha str. Grapes]